MACWRVEERFHRYVTCSIRARVIPSINPRTELEKKVTEDVLLSVPHRFWTFSIPKAIRGILLRDRRLLKLVLRCAFEAVKQAMKDALPQGSAASATCGAILAIHTAGNLLQWNPHGHGIVSEGLFDRQGQFHHIPDLDAKLVDDLFFEKLLTELLKNKRISPGLVASMATWRHSGFSVHSTRAPADPKDPAFFHMLRYMARPAVALSKMSFDPKDEKVIYIAGFNALLGTDRIEVETLEFVAKVLMHVSDKHSRRVTAYGVYSSRSLGERRKQARGEEQAAGIGATVSFYEPLTEADECAKRRRQSWARLIQRVFEVSPLTCSRCGAEMRVVSVITEPVVIDKILGHIAKKDRAPSEGHPAA